VHARRHVMHALVGLELKQRREIERRRKL